MGGDQRAEACDAGGHQRHVRHRADGDDREYVLAADALAQYEGVLGSDRDDERETGGEADQQWSEHAIDVRVVRSISTANAS